MTSDEAIVKVIQTLESLGIPYMLVGSLSSSTYGMPRSSQDADVLVSFENNAVVRHLVDHLGPEFHFDLQMTFEGVTATHRHEAVVKETQFKIEFFHVGEDPYDLERFQRRVRLEIKYGPAWLPTPEDVIVNKLRWARSKDQADIKDVIAVRGKFLDWNYIYSWADRHNTRELLDQLRASLPAID
ncbi:MAG: nucleotidyltransferase [Gemmataceae bacterium]